MNKLYNYPSPSKVVDKIALNKGNGWYSDYVESFEQTDIGQCWD